jgi:osmoprotectant transport system ATP-binding protein
MPLIEFRYVFYEIGGRPVLSDLNLQVETGETLVLLGRRGSGESTALRLTNRML